MSSEDNITLRKLGPKDAKKSVHRAFRKKRPLFLWGPPGIGKSDIIREIGSELSAHVIDIRLSLWEPTDIKGIPFYNSEIGKMDWAPPVDLPDAEMASKHKQIILFLDEMNSAPPMVQAAAYQLILDRKIGRYTLPENVIIIAAGNREGDRGVTYRMPAPLANRFVHIEMVHSYTDWFSWAVDNKIHKDVVGFITHSKQSLFDFDPSSPSRSFATPRSWCYVSDLLEDDDGDEEVTSNLVSGAVGEGLAMKFMAHRRVSGSLPNPEDVLSGKVDTTETKEISAMYSLIVSLCYELKEACDENNPAFDKMVDNFLKFVMKNFETELVVMGIKLALTEYSLPIDPDAVPSFDEFHERYGRYITAAG